MNVTTVEYSVRSLSTVHNVSVCFFLYSITFLTHIKVNSKTVKTPFLSVGQ